jgi:hypothetical protein
MKRSTIILIITGVLCTIGAVICIIAAAAKLTNMGVDFAKTSINGHEYVWNTGDDANGWKWNWNSDETGGSGTLSDGTSANDALPDGTSSANSTNKVDVNLPFLNVQVDEGNVHVNLPGIKVDVDDSSDKVNVKIGGDATPASTADGQLPTVAETTVS